MSEGHDVKQLDGRFSNILVKFLSCLFRISEEPFQRDNLQRIRQTKVINYNARRRKTFLMNSSLVHESRAAVLTINNMRLISDSGGRRSALARLQLPHRTGGGGVSRRDDVERVVLVLVDRSHRRDALVVRVGVQGASLVRRGVIVL